MLLEAPYEAGLVENCRKVGMTEEQVINLEIEMYGCIETLRRRQKRAESTKSKEKCSMNVLNV